MINDHKFSQTQIFFFLSDEKDAVTWSYVLCVCVCVVFNAWTKCVKMNWTIQDSQCFFAVHFFFVLSLHSFQVFPLKPLIAHSERSCVITKLFVRLANWIEPYFSCCNFFSCFEIRKSNDNQLIHTKVNELYELSWQVY